MLAEARGIADHERVATKCLAGEEQAARQAERPIEVAVERGFEAREVDAELAHEVLGNRAVQRLRRLHRLAAAVADDPAAVERELVALGVAAEVVVVVEDQDAGPWADGAPVEPRRRETADAAADDHQIVAILHRQIVHRKRSAFTRERMRGLERAGVVAAQSGECWRIASRLREDLRRRRQAGRNGKGDTVEEVAAREHGSYRLSGIRCQELGK